MNRLDGTARKAWPTEDAGRTAARVGGPVSHGLQVKHLATAALSVSVFLAAGVYWLHHREEGPAIRRVDDSVSQVRVVTLSMPAPSVADAAIPQSETLADPAPLPTIEASRPVPERPAAPHPSAPQERLARVAAADIAAPPVSMPAGAVTSDALPDYLRRLRAHIEQFHEYPEAARAERLQGTVQVIFTLGRSGDVVGVRIKSSSGHAILDQAAIEMIRRARPLPEIPQLLPGQVTVVLPVEFSAP